MSARSLSSAADWSPSRFNYAIFRLTAWLLVRQRPAPSERDDSARFILAFHAWQSPAEAYLVAVFFGGTVCLYLYRVAQLWWMPGIVATILLALPIYIAAIVLIHLSMFAIGLLLTILRRLRLYSRPTNIGGQCLGHNAIMLALAVFAAGSESWIRWVGLVWIAVLALNGVAYLVSAALRRQIEETVRRLEQ